jgi:molybdopterin molybdotransferase
LLDTHQVVVLTGGVSVGQYDYVPEAVKLAGGVIRFHGVRMKPGKPQLYASFKGNRHVFGLPGNPLSALTGLFELVLPGLRRMAGVTAKLCSPKVTVTLAKQVSSKGERVYFCLARLVNSTEGLSAIPVSVVGSADLVAAGRADGVIKIAVGVKEVQAGTLVEFHPWKQIL